MKWWVTSVTERMQFLRVTSPHVLLLPLIIMVDLFKSQLTAVTFLTSLWILEEIKSHFLSTLKSYFWENYFFSFPFCSIMEPSSLAHKRKTSKAMAFEEEPPSLVVLVGILPFRQNHRCFSLELPFHSVFKPSFRGSNRCSFPILSHVELRYQWLGSQLQRG